MAKKAKKRAAPRTSPRLKKAAFIAALEVTGNKTASAKAAEIDRKTAWQWEQDDEAFAEAVQDALSTAAAKLEEEARRRAVEGERELETYQGYPIFVWTDAEGNVVPHGHPDALHQRPLYKDKRSDTLLIFLLKGAMPEKYRERHETKHTGDPNSPIHHKVDLSEIRRELLDEAELQSNLRNVAVNDDTGAVRTDGKQG